MFIKHNQAYEHKFKELTESFESTFINVTKNINDSKTEILSDIRGQISKLHTELSYRVGEIEKRIQDIEGLREEVAKLKENAERQDNILVSTKRPANLYTVFEQIRSAIDVSTPSFLAIFRMKNKVNNNGNQY